MTEQDARQERCRTGVAETGAVGLQVMVVSRQQ